MRLKTALVSIALAFLFSFSLIPTVSSAEKNIVCSDIITSVKKGDTFSIPIMIKHCDNVLGLKLSFCPTGNEIKVIDVVSDKLTKSGMLNHNSDIKEGSFDVVWSGVEAINEDGIIFTLKAVCVESFSDFSYVIKYSKEDTFDDKYTNIPLCCKTIVITGNNGTDATISQKRETSENDEKTIDATADKIISEIGKSNVYSIINGLLVKYEETDVNGILPDETQSFIDDVSKRVPSFSEETHNYSPSGKMALIDMLLRKTTEVSSADELTSVSVSGQRDSNHCVSFAVIIVALICVVICATVIFRNRRRKANEKNN